MAQTRSTCINREMVNMYVKARSRVAQLRATNKNWKLDNIYCPKYTDFCKGEPFIMIFCNAGPLGIKLITVEVYYDCESGCLLEKRGTGAD